MPMTWYNENLDLDLEKMLEKKKIDSGKFLYHPWGSNLIEECNKHGNVNISQKNG